MDDTALTACDVVGLDDVETLDSLMSRAMLALAARGATGELVCACRRGECCIYLQRGRVAWANDVEHRHAFTAHLKAHARLDTPTIEAVVAECSRTGRPIGETLVASGLASEAQVRSALRHQIELALHIGRCDERGRIAFVGRGFGPYDLRFTFTASDLVSDGEAS